MTLHTPFQLHSLIGHQGQLQHVMVSDMDGGVRSGQDVLKAVALGAKGVYIGRAFIYGLGAMGEAGVTKALEIIRKEMDITMALCGKTHVGELDRTMLAGGVYD